MRFKKDWADVWRKGLFDMIGKWIPHIERGHRRAVAFVLFRWGGLLTAGRLNLVDPDLMPQDCP